VLADTGDRYEDTVELAERVRVDVRRFAAADPTDADLAAVAQSGQVWISLENFRGLPLDTVVVYGFGSDLITALSDGALRALLVVAQGRAAPGPPAARPRPAVRGRRLVSRVIEPPGCAAGRSRLDLPRLVSRGRQPASRSPGRGRGS
jgi:hypothetical protein